ncbi:MAG: hypothetical protein AAGI28_13105 [Pseudomonadota bacterium]
MFGKKSLADFSEDELEFLALGYLTATDEIAGLVTCIRDERQPSARGQELADLLAMDELLVSHHNKLITFGKSLPPPSSDLQRLIREAEAIEKDVSRISEALYGFDEARVSGCIMVIGSLEAKTGNVRS